VEALKKQGLWDRVKDKIVYADNIGMAKQYGTSGNADAVFTAWSLVLKESGKVTPVDEALHKPIMQELGIVAKSAHQAEARAFSEYLIAGKGRQILTSHGYRPPAGKMGK
jgi:molybdate transport system substrate-binding protein